MLALLGMSVVTRYVDLEMAQANLFTALLGANPGPALSILAIIRNNNVRSEAFRAVAKDALAARPNDLDFFGQVLALIEAADKHRNRIAHWAWATEPQYPESVILLDPRKMALVQADVAKLNDSGKVEHEQALAVQQRMYDAAMIYNKRDFSDALDAIQTAVTCTITMSILVGHAPEHPEAANARKVLGIAIRK